MPLGLGAAMGATTMATAWTACANASGAGQAASANLQNTATMTLATRATTHTPMAPATQAAQAQAILTTTVAPAILLSTLPLLCLPAELARPAHRTDSA